jgi:hypothetical protein
MAWQRRALALASRPTVSVVTHAAARGRGGSERLLDFPFDSTDELRLRVCIAMSARITIRIDLRTMAMRRPGASA